VVVTSRRRLDGLVARSGARLLPLSLLPADRATALIGESASEAGVGLGDGQAAELARLADHLPLALRVIAARLAVAPGRVDQFVAELRDERTRLAALDLEHADTSVRAALDVSYRSLHPAIGSAFRMLGLTPGSTVDPYVLAALCGTSVDSADRRLRALAEANLVGEAGARRFVMHDLVRLHAKGLAETELSASATDDALGRLLRYYRATCDHARRRLHPPRDDLDFAARFPARERPSLESAEQATEWFGVEWPNLCALLHSTVAAGRHLEAWQLVLLAAHHLTTSTGYRDWCRWAQIGLASARTIGDADGEVQMLIVLSTARSRYGHGAEALEDAQSALRIATRLGDSRHIRIALGNVASGLYGQARYREALLCDQESYRLSVESGDLIAQAHALNNMSQVERVLGRRAEAAGHVRAAVRLWAELGDTSHQLLSLNNLAELDIELDRLDEAEELAGQALRLATVVRSELQAAFARELHGRVLLARGDHGAVGELRAALALSEQLDLPRVAELRTLLAGIETPEAGV
jgi:tetratricopeptide (TPR) repeat protein